MELPGELLETFVDYLLPLLTPYEASIYLVLLRLSHVAMRSPTVRIGIRTLSAKCGRGTRSASGGNMQHISKVLAALEKKKCLSIGDKTREGTLLTVRLPWEIPAVKEKMAMTDVGSRAPDYYEDAELRRKLFERDSWRCLYCGDSVNAETATLDHKIPRSKGGTNEPDNLATCCFICNSIKSGKSYEEVAPALLASLRERRSKLSTVG
jgi:hypothetical protein